MKFYDKKIEDVFEELSSKKEGLSEEEAEKRIEKYGENNIKAGEEISPFMIFLNQFRNALVYILMIVVLISGLLNKWIDVYVILGVIIFNAIMGFFQEYKAEKAIESLRNMIEPTARVYREGGLKEISAKKLVPGDVVLLKEGDRIPADLRFFQTKNLRTEEALLTGESIPVNKTTKKLSAKTDLGDRENMGHMGTFVAGGQGEGVVTATGEETSFGKIATDLRSIEKTKNHFEERSSTLAKQMSLFALAGFFVIFLLALFRIGVGWEGIKTFSSEFQEVFLFSSSALVSGIPEGLPAILAIVLAIGATKMAKKNAVIRKLSATETLGVTTDIITDKTGTLTQNTMTIREIILPGEEKIEVTGAGWEAEGDFYQEDNVILPLEKENLNKLLYIAAICNDAKVIRNEETKVIGDPTEAALSVLAEKAGLKDYLRESKEKRIDRHPFNSK
ncbi:MAG: cation-translocating P-type ATPase, partial [Minisyncoccales bacterium]